ncbi:MAG: 50S ribosomal protein L6 [Verrucomicrobiae bacterium]|nr:50S ribosomal protein L6 [Verrucomicrobiae bacterium]
MSRIGNKPVSYTDKVKVALEGRRIKIEGPKGKLDWELPVGISAKVENQSIHFERKADSAEQKALHGLSRSLAQNMVRGVTEGFQKKLEIQGVGFKAAVQGSKLNLSLGFSHPILFDIPKDIKVQVIENTQIVIDGADKQKVGEVAASIRRYYPPEPYKGKGIRYAGEQVRRKVGKTAGQTA